MDALNTQRSAINLGAEGLEDRLMRLSAMGADADATEAAEMFEALLATMMVKEARRGLGDGGFFGKGPGADVFNGWMDKHMGQSLADGWDLDLAGMVRQGLIEKQEGSG